MNTIKVMQTLIFFFFKSSRGMSSFYIIFFSSILSIYIYIYILWFFMYFLKSNFHIWTIKLSLTIFYKIKKYAIIEIIVLNITHLSLIFLYYLVIYIVGAKAQICTLGSKLYLLIWIRPRRNKWLKKPQNK